MTPRRSNKIGSQEQRNLPENPPVQPQRSDSKELFKNVQKAVLSHLEVDSVEDSQQAESPIELHVHHHHHVCMDNQRQPAASPRITRTTDASISRSWIGYEDIANKTFIDILWTKNQPYYRSKITSKKEAWKPVPESSCNLPEVTCLHATMGPKIAKSASTPVTNSSVEEPPRNVVAKESTAAQSGAERKRATRMASKSKIRSLEEAAQERIKRLADLGTLLSKPEIGYKENPRKQSRLQSEKREAASQTQIDDLNVLFGKLKEETSREKTFKEESEAAEASFVAALEAAKIRLHDLVNECARANARPYGPYVPEDILRKQKELRALEELHSYFVNQEVSSTEHSDKSFDCLPSAPCDSIPAASPLSPGTELSSPPSEMISSQPGTCEMKNLSPEEVVGQFQDDFVEEMLTNLPRPERFGRKFTPPVDEVAPVKISIPSAVKSAAPMSEVSPVKTSGPSALKSAAPTSEQEQSHPYEDITGISSTAEYMKLFERQTQRASAPNRDAEARMVKGSSLYPWARIVESEAAKMASGLSNIQEALQHLERKLTNVENLRQQVVDTLKIREEVHKREEHNAGVSGNYTLYKSPISELQAEGPSKKQIVTHSTYSVTPVQEKDARETRQMLTTYPGMVVQEKDAIQSHQQDVAQKLSLMISESEKLRAFISDTKQRVLDEDRKNVILKQCVGDASLHKKEHAILDSSLDLNKELLDSLSGMEDALANFANHTRNLLPFIDEHLAISRRLREVVSTPFVKELKISCMELNACGKTAEAKRNKVQQEGVSDDMRDAQLLLIKEIEETKKQSKEMVEIMDSLEQHYSILKNKFTRGESEVPRNNFEENAAARLAAGIQDQCEELQAQLTCTKYSEPETQSQMQNLARRKQDLEDKLHVLEHEISISHGQVQELKTQNQQIKNLVESKEREAGAMKRKTGDIQWRVIQLEEQLAQKENQIATLRAELMETKQLTR